MNNEIDKIITYFQDKKIDERELEILLDLKINDDFNLLRDEALKGNIRNTNKLLSETMLEEEKNVYYLNLINMRLNRIKELKKLAVNKNIEAAISDLKPPIFWKEKPYVKKQLINWSATELKKLINDINEIELLSKKNSQISQSLLLNLIFESSKTFNN